MSVAVTRPRTGVVTDSYSTRAGERVWLVDWDDRQLTAPIDLTYAEEFAIGQRVRLVGDRLERVR